MIKGNKKDRLSTVLDTLPEGDGTETGFSLKKLPPGVSRRALYKDIVTIALPSFMELILGQLASMVDLMMVGAIGGSAAPELGAMALTAVGLTNQPKFLAMAALVALNVGVTALIARYKGLHEYEKANLVARQGLLFSFIAAVFISALIYGFARPLIIFMGSKEELVTLWGTQYLQIQMAGFMTMALTSSITAALRGVGDSRSSMIYNLTANAVNVVLNWLLIFGHLGFPEMGVAGASLATVIGQLVALCMALRIVLRGNGVLKLEPRLGFRPHRPTLENLVDIGLPSMVEQLLMRAGMIIFSITVASLGTAAFATHQVCMNIQALSFMTGQAFAVSSTSLVGQSLGRRRPDMAQAYCSGTQRLGMGVGFVIMLVFVFFGGDIVGLYNNSPEIVSIGGKIMLFVAVLQPLQASQFILAGGLRGAGDTRSTAVITTITMLCLRPPMALLLVHLGFGLYGAWAAIAADQLLRSTLVIVRYRGGKWKAKQLKNNA